MLNGTNLIRLLCVAASLSAQAQTQRDIVKRVNQLRAELLTSSPDDDARVAKAGYLNGHLEEIESLVRQAVIQALNAGDSSGQLLERIRPMVRGNWNSARR